MPVSDLKPEDYFRVRSELNEVHVLASERFIGAISNAQKYLLLTNSGAAGALVAFMGASAEVRQTPHAWWALALFVVGILLVGVIAGFNFFVFRGAFVRLTRDIGALLRYEIEFAEYHRRRASEKDRPWILRVGLAAYLTFMLGIAIAVIGLYPIARIANPPTNIRIVTPDEPRVDAPDVPRAPSEVPVPIAPPPSSSTPSPP